jgi:hypothetical protein
MYTRTYIHVHHTHTHTHTNTHAHYKLYQGVSIILWSHAKMKAPRPSEHFLRFLETEAISVAHEFNPQEISNTLWAYAALETHPSEELLRRLDARVMACSSAFSPLSISNTLWAFVKMKMTPSPALMRCLETRAIAIARRFMPQVCYPCLYLCIHAYVCKCINKHTHELL